MYWSILIQEDNNKKESNGYFKQVINKHLSHEDDIDVGKDEQIVEIERKLSMRRQRIFMRMMIKFMSIIIFRAQ